MTETYAADKPSSCRYCYYWKDRKTGCTLGKENCFYEKPIQQNKKKKSKSECDNCPYGRAQPCIGWCTKQIIRELGIH